MASVIGAFLLIVFHMKWLPDSRMVAALEGLPEDDIMEAKRRGFITGFLYGILYLYCLAHLFSYLWSF